MYHVVMKVMTLENTICPKVYLTPEQIKKAWEIGTARNAAKPDGIRQNDSGYHSDNADRAHPHRLGIAAEIVYSQLTGLPLDERIMSSGDTSDFGGIEIKSATWMGEDIELKVKKTEYERKRPKIYVLARVAQDIRFVEFIGCVGRDRFEREKYEKKHKFVINYCMQGCDLRKALPIVEDDSIKLVPFMGV